MKKLKEQQNKKVDCLIVKKNMQDGLRNDLNNLISNLTGKMLSATEIEILKYGLKHGIATRPSEVEMIVLAENIWDQIEQKGLCKWFMIWEIVKISLRAFTHSYMDIYSHNKKRINLIKQTCEKYMILNPDKGNGVVLINKVDYHNAMNQCFLTKRNLKLLKTIQL